MILTNIIKGYINRRTDKILEDLILVVSDLTDSIVDLHTRTLSLEKTVKNSLQPRRVIKNGKIETS